MKLTHFLISCLASSALCAVSTAGLASSAPPADSGSPAAALATPATNVSNPSTPTVGANAAVGEDARRVCRVRDTLGSRLRAVRICRTQAEWRQLDDQGRKNAKKLTDRGPNLIYDPKLGGG
jgi:hypothetical protein